MTRGKWGGKAKEERGKIEEEEKKDMKGKKGKTSHAIKAGQRMDYVHCSCQSTRVW